MSWLAYRKLLILVAWTPGCVDQLDRAVACGDQHVDVLAGEECEPSVPSSFVNACRTQRPDKPEGTSACDLQTCTFDLSGCGLCGDGHIDAGEECDGDNFNGRTCPIRLPGLRCTPECRIDDSGCPSCGNGILDSTEECDFNASTTDPRACAGDDIDPPLPPPTAGLPYASGESTRCNTACRYDRARCSYCGDDQLQGDEQIDTVSDARSLPEVCDQEQRDTEALRARVGNFCYQRTDVDLAPNVGCADNCLAFVERPVACCMQRGERCPPTTAPFQCCHFYNYPDETPCRETVDINNQLVEICR